MADFDPKQIEAQVRSTAKEMGVNPDFAAQIARQESGFNPNLTSPRGAVGVMQVMPDTAAELAPRFGNDNIRQGVGYLKDLDYQLKSIPEQQRHLFVAAAYNAGPGRLMEVTAKVKGAGLDPTNIASYRDFLPDETLGYLANMGKALPTLQTGKAKAAAGGTAKRVQPIGQALMSSLASEGERQRANVGTAIEAARGLVRPTGEATPGQALGASGRAIMSGLQAAEPVLAPAMTAGGVTGETLARTGTVPLTPEQGSQAGKLAAGVATLTPKTVTSGLKALQGLEKVISRTHLMTPAIMATLVHNPGQVGNVVTMMLGRAGLAGINMLQEQPRVQAILAGLSQAGGNKADTVRLLGALASEIGGQKLGKTSAPAG